MNLDRFEIGLEDQQQVPAVAECEACGGELYSGNEAVSFDGVLFCDKDCLTEFLIDTADYSEVYLT